MATIPCPGCTTALEPSATVCPVCLRPRNRIEITRAFATLRVMEQTRRRRPFLIAGYVLASGAAAWLLFRYQKEILAISVSAVAGGRSLVDQGLSGISTSVDQSMARPASVPPASPLPGAPAAPPPPALPAVHPPEPAAPAPAKIGRPPAVVEDLPLPTFDSTAQWAVYGRVYDLTTLLPVADAQLGFATVGGAGSYAAAGARSDANGRFSVVLPRLAEGSYEIHAARAGYASSALYESDIPYAHLSLAQRRDIARSAQDGDLPLPPLTDVSGQASLRRDVFLAPQR